MRPNIYQSFVEHANFTENDRDAMFLAALGLNGESGEVSEHIKKHLLHGKPLDVDKVKDELSDVLWYLFHSFNVFGLTFEEVATHNVKKLCERHPTNGDPSQWIE